MSEARRKSQKPRGGKRHNADRIRHKKKGRILQMNTFQYEVVSIDGDYANLRRIDTESDELKLVARALLPPEIMEGTKLLYEMLQYEIMQ